MGGGVGGIENKAHQSASTWVWQKVSVNNGQLHLQPPPRVVHTSRLDQFYGHRSSPSKDPKQLEKKEKRRQCLKELKKRTYCILVCVK